MKFALFCIALFCESLLAGNVSALPIDSAKNHIEFPAGDASFTSFLGKMDSLLYMKEGTVNILHLGGSHIQADIFSDRIRMRLVQDLPLPAASRGFVFPYTAAKSNTPSSYASRKRGHFKNEKSISRKRKNSVGITGFRVTAIDPESEIRIVLNPRKGKPKIWSFTKVRVFGEAKGPAEPVLKLSEDGERLSGVRDSVSGSFVFELSERADSLILEFPWRDSAAIQTLADTLAVLDSAGKEALFSNDAFFRQMPSFSLTGIVLSDTVSGLTYNSIGVNGANLESYLSIEDFERDLDFSRPDLVIFSIGINDANVEKFNAELFKARYDTLVYRVRKVSPNAAILFMSNNDCYLTSAGKPNKNGILVAKAMRELAESHQSGLWDLFHIMGGLGSIDAWFDEGFAQKDHVHFKAPGYEILGDLFFEALRELFFPDPEMTRLKGDAP